jgi:hypothetical protein
MTVARELANLEYTDREYLLIVYYSLNTQHTRKYCMHGFYMANGCTETGSLHQIRE